MERNFNMNNIIPFLVLSVLLVLVSIIGTYKESQRQVALSESAEVISCSKKLLRSHSVAEIFVNYNKNVPRIFSSVLVYSRFNILFVICGTFCLNGYTTGSNIASLFGASIGFNILGKVLSGVYGCSQGSIYES